ncbi:hypothetical protein TWF696_007079 [Orbilia brochopaga]|uniref:J domain-containing protein n=1 Tax=Orbilia brochopaga TaxID=3140254 RepID=A0AAV9UXF1_9PEZI
MPKEDVTVDHYAALEVSVTATADEIRKQFRKLALKYHPDRNPGREAEFNAKFQQIQAAHELLTDAVRRKLYDRSRLCHSSFSKTKAQQYPEASTPSREPSSRKYTASSTTRSNFPTANPRSGEGHFSPSSKTQWEQPSRHYNQNGPSAWKATHEKWPRPTRETPRTPKKTRENPYASADADPRSSREQVHANTYKDEGIGGKTPLKHSFFGDRNPREREWMDPTTEPRSTGNSNRNGSGIWETKSSSEEDAPRTSTFYAYTPQTRLRTNLRDTSPDKHMAHGVNSANGTTTNGKSSAASPADPSISPLRSGSFTRSRDQREYGEQQIPPQNHDRRKSSSSINTDGPERRKFSYLFNEDGSRRPHRPAKQNGGSDQDAEEDFLSKNRNVPMRQSYPSSRRNTLDRDPMPSKSPLDSKTSNGLKHAERARFNPPSYNQSEGVQTQFNPFKTFETGRFSPVSAPSGSPAEHQHPKTFSIADWNAMFNGDENIFAVPARKGQQSPRKVPAIPKIQTSFNPGNIQLNFSRPRPTSTSAEGSGKPKDTIPERQSHGVNSAESLESTGAPDSFPKNTFAFEDWEKAFSENNPFDVNRSQQNASSTAARSTSRHRKATSVKKSAASAPQSKTSHADENPTLEPHISEPAESQTENIEEFHSQPSESAFQPAAPSENAQATNTPSPLAMDIDTPRESPKPAPAVPITPTNRNFTTPRNSGIYHSPTVSDENPVSPIRGDGPPISPLRAEEVPRPDEDTEGQSPISSTCKSPPPNLETEESLPATASSINLDALRGVEPMTYAPSTGLDGNWKGMQDTLPFDSRAAPVLNISPSPPPRKTPIRIPTPPEAPAMPSVLSAALYDRNCAAMTVYQTHWNDYNAKIVNHLKARLETDVLRCAQNKGFATGTSSDPKAGIHIDLIQTQKALDELEEDQQVRAQWETAVRNHASALMQWKRYLERLHAVGELN